MRITPSRRVSTIAALVLGATLLTGTAAVAAPPGWTPVSGDDRATAHADDHDGTTTCAQAGLPGTAVTWPGLEDASGTYVTIHAADIPAGDTIGAVVVKGGPGYNVYLAATLGALPWANLHSPYTPNDNQVIARISHWFACVTGQEETTGATTTTETTKSTTATTAATTTNPGGSATTTTGATTTTAALAAGPTTTPPTSKPLAYTGFGQLWLLWLALALLVAGAAVVALPRLIRHRAS